MSPAMTAMVIWTSSVVRAIPPSSADLSGAAWADYMAKATEGQPVRQFAGPAYVNKDSSPLLLRPHESAEHEFRASKPTESRSSEQNKIRRNPRRRVGRPNRRVRRRPRQALVNQPADEREDEERPRKRPPVGGELVSAPELTTDVRLGRTG